MKQRTDEWEAYENMDKGYHERQFRETYRSTVAFCNWLEKIGFIHSESQLSILDLGSGQGANIYYMSKRYPKSTFLGIDINRDLVDKGNSFFKNNGVLNCFLKVGDIYNLDSSYISGFQGVVSLQTLSWLPEFKNAMNAIIKLEPQWIALTSLFYDGQISCTNEVIAYDDSLTPYQKFFYNIYSLPVLTKYLILNGYPDYYTSSFEIDIDLPKPNKKLMTTYTEKLEDGHRLQISGPLLMPWYFVAARK